MQIGVLYFFENTKRQLAAKHFLPYVQSVIFRLVVFSEVTSILNFYE